MEKTREAHKGFYVIVLGTVAGWTAGDCPIYGWRYRTIIAN